ncbi:MAG TPA: hypothetical protein VFC38_02175 [Stellaceae bacterium]|nr:hypothetical protein [Stellaceae bacterium]
MTGLLAPQAADIEDELDAIDMDRVVADPDYRRRVVLRLRRGVRLVDNWRGVESDED